MTKARIERLMELGKMRRLVMSIGELIELGRLLQEFDQWEPEAPTPAPSPSLPRPPRLPTASCWLTRESE